MLFPYNIFFIEVKWCSHEAFLFFIEANGLRKRKQNQFIFSIDNLNNLATKMANKETLQKNNTEQTRLFSLHLTPLNFKLDENGWIRKEK
jgi:hypothetical protein